MGILKDYRTAITHGRKNLLPEARRVEKFLQTMTLVLDADPPVEPEEEEDPMSFVSEEQFRHWERKKLAETYRDCDACRRCHERSRVVFGEGNLFASLAVLGEGPGKTEDEKGRTFIGPAGSILRRLLSRGDLLGDAYLMNRVRCFGPTPEPDETTACRPLLDVELRLVNPIVVLALGSTALSYWNRKGVGRNRGWLSGVRRPLVYCSWHPAAIIWKKNAGEGKAAARMLRELSADIERVAKALPLLERRYGRERKRWDFVPG